MTFNLLNELKDKVMLNIAKVLSERENNNLKIDLVEFRYEVGSEFTYNCFEFELLNKDTDELVANVTFNNVNGNHITIYKKFSDKKEYIIREPIKMSEFKTALAEFLK